LMFPDLKQISLIFPESPFPSLVAALVFYSVSKLRHDRKLEVDHDHQSGGRDNKRRNPSRIKLRCGYKYS